MKNCGLIRTMSVQRVQSQDDYSLITSNGYSGRSYFTGMGQNSGMFSPSHNDFSKSSINLLMDERGQYEKSRRISRYNMFWERHDNRCRMLTFQSAPQDYKCIFNIIVEDYLQIRSSCQALEEFWVFLIESVYQKTSQGYLIFEDQHKLLFRQEVLENRYIEEFLKDVQRNYNQLEKSISAQPHNVEIRLTQTQSILNEIGGNLIALENEINTSI